MDIHSVAFRLLCWKRRSRGVERRREVYWRWSWDLRNSGGLWEGGCVGGKRASGGEEEMVWWIGGAGVIAEAVERYLGRGMRLLWRRFRHWVQRCRRGGMALGEDFTQLAPGYHTSTRILTIDNTVVTDIERSHKLLPSY